MRAVIRRLEKLIERLEYGNITRDQVVDDINTSIDELLEGEGENNGII